MFYRILNGVGANLFGQIVTLVIQILSVSVFLSYWDVATYGKWLILTSIPIYLSMADIGMVSVAANKMLILKEQGDQNAANEIFQCTLVMVLVAILIIAIIAAILLYTPLFFDSIERRHKIALYMLIILALLNVFSSLYDALFKASGEYARGTYIQNFCRLIEWGFGVALLPFGGGYCEVAGGFLLGRLLSIIWVFLYLKRNPRGFSWGWGAANIKEIKLMLRPAIAFMGFPIGNAINIQGVNLIVGMTFGPICMAMFNTYRTISRVLVQLVTVVSRAVWPEITRLYASGEINKLNKLLQMGSIGIGILASISAVFIYLMSPWILETWTHGKIALDSNLLGLLLIGSALTSFWQLYMVATMATNNHEKLSLYFLVGSSFFSVILYAVGKDCGVYFSTVVLIIFEIYMFFASRCSIKSLVRY